MTGDTAAHCSGRNRPVTPIISSSGNSDHRRLACSRRRRSAGSSPLRAPALTLATRSLVSARSWFRLAVSTRSASAEGSTAEAPEMRSASPNESSPLANASAVVGKVFIRRAVSIARFASEHDVPFWRAQPILGRPGLAGMRPAGVDPLGERSLLGRQLADHPAQPLHRDHRIGPGVQRRIGLVAPRPDDPLDVGQRRDSGGGGGRGAHFHTVYVHLFDCNRNNGDVRRFRKGSGRREQ